MIYHTYPMSMEFRLLLRCLQIDPFPLIALRWWTIKVWK